MPDEIEQRQRTHGIAAAKLHGIVDILDRRHAFFQRAHRVQQIRHQQPIYDESGAVARCAPAFCRASRRRPPLPRKPSDRWRWCESLPPASSIGTGLKKCRPTKRSGRAVNIGHLGDRKRRCVARKNRVLRANLVERRVQFFLRRQLFDDRFHHDDRSPSNLPALWCRAAARASASRTSAVSVPFSTMRLQDSSRSIAGLCAAISGETSRTTRFAAGLRGHLRDARAHQAAAHHSYFFNRHSFSSGKLPLTDMAQICLRQRLHDHRNSLPAADARRGQSVSRTPPA